MRVRRPYFQEWTRSSRVGSRGGAGDVAAELVRVFHLGEKQDRIVHAVDAKL